MQIPEKYQEFEDLFREEQGPAALPEHQEWDCVINLKEGAKPVSEPLRRMSASTERTLKEWTDKMMKIGHIRESRSPFGAPLFLVPKPNTNGRPVVDWRKLNAQTIKDCYALPLLDDLRDRLQGAKIFSQIDLKSAFNLIRMKEGEEYKTAFRTPWGLYEFLVMHFGMCNAPATFQRLINNVLREYLDIFCVVYLDDILVYSKNVNEHEKHVRLVFKALRKYHLKVGLDKCKFDATEVRFCGYIITTEGIRMDPKKVSAVLEWNPPSTVKQIQEFLGFANYYRRFIKGYSSIAKPLTDLTHKDRKFEWTIEADRAFQQLKEAFAIELVLTTFDLEKKIRLETDSLDYAVGAVLS